MAAATAPTWMFAALLLIAGVAKIAKPAATGAALQGARLPSDARLVRLLGLGEVGLAVAVLFVGGWLPAALLAAAYAAFAGFTAYQSRRGAGCGCFGDATAPATNLHVGVDVAGAVASIGAALVGAPSLPAAVSGVQLALAIAGVALGAELLRLLLTAVPELASALALHRAEGSA